MMQARRFKAHSFTRAGFLSAGVGTAAGIFFSSMPAMASEDTLPAASPDPEDAFGVDLNINMDTIDDYLGRSDAVYRDMRLLDDPAEFEFIGGESILDFTVEGFKITPLPYIATLAQMPVSGAYEGESLFQVQWSDDGEVVSAVPRFEQSQLIVEELFPKDKAVFLMCGGGGYAGMMRKLLIFLGWDEARVYNVGGAWDYCGYNAVELARHNPDGTDSWFLWRADIATIDFSSYDRLDADR